MPVTSTIIQTKDNVYGNNNSVEYNPMAISGLSKLVICNTADNVYTKELFITGITYDDSSDNFLKTGFDLVFTNDTYPSHINKFTINGDTNWNIISVETEIKYKLEKNKIYKCRLVNNNGLKFIIYNGSDGALIKYDEVSQTGNYVVSLGYVGYGFYDFYFAQDKQGERFMCHLQYDVSMPSRDDTNYFKLDIINNDLNFYLDKLIHNNVNPWNLCLSFNNISGGTTSLYGLKYEKSCSDGIHINNYWNTDSEFIIESMPSSYKSISIPRQKVISITNKATQEVSWT